MSKARELLEKLQKLVEKSEDLHETQINEFKKSEAGEKISFENFHDAVKKLYDKYKNNEISAYCEDVISKKYKFNGKDIKLCLIVGGEIIETENGSFEIVYNSGLGHSMQHAGQKVNGKIITEKDLKSAINVLPEALKLGDWYDEDVVIHDKGGKEQIVTRLLIDYKEFVYIIAFAEDETEIDYLLNAFKPDRGYIKRRLDNKEITPREKEIVEN